MSLSVDESFISWGFCAVFGGRESISSCGFLMACRLVSARTFYLSIKHKLCGLVNAIQWDEDSNGNPFILKLSKGINMFYPIEFRFIVPQREKIAKELWKNCDKSLSYFASRKWKRNVMLSNLWNCFKMNCDATKWVFLSLVWNIPHGKYSVCTFFLPRWLVIDKPYRSGCLVWKCLEWSGWFSVA